MQSVKTNRRRMTSQRQAVYVEGTAARNLYVVPNENPRKRETVPEKKREVRREIRTQTLPLSGASVLVLTAAAILTLIICVQYVQLQSEITFRLRTINQLETELNDLTILNNEADKRINCFIDLDYIYKVATEELGMHYANEGQITLYNNSGAEYVRQYKDIPE